MKKEQKKTETEQKTSKLAIVSFVLGVFSLIIFFLYYILIIKMRFRGGGLLGVLVLVWGITPLLSLCSVLTGIAGLVKIYLKPQLYKGKFWSILGLILGIIILAVFYYILFIMENVFGGGII